MNLNLNFNLKSKKLFSTVAALALITSNIFSVPASAQEIQRSSSSSSAVPNANAGSFYISMSADSTGKTAAAYNKAPLNTAYKNTNTWFDVTTNFRYVPQLAGTYLITGQCGAITGTLGETTQAAIYLNGVQFSAGYYQTQSTVVGGFVESITSTMITVNGTTDFIELYCYLPAAVTTLSGGNRYRTFMMGYYVAS